MLSGLEKAQALVAILKENSRDVLSKLSEESASKLTASIDNAPEPDQEDLTHLLEEALAKIDEFQQAEFEGATEESAGFDELPEEESLDFSSMEETSEEEEVEEEEKEEESNIRDMTDIATILSKQRPQIIAFMLAKIEPKMKVELESHLSDTIMSEVEEKDVEKIPLGQKVFENLYNLIFLKTGDMEVAEGEETLSFGLGSEPLTVTEGSESVEQIPAATTDTNEISDKISDENLETIGEQEDLEAVDNEPTPETSLEESVEESTEEESIEEEPVEATTVEASEEDEDLLAIATEALNK